jgi:hypothetical protein
MAARKVPRTRSPRARGLRTLQHQTLSLKARYALETEVWFRALLLQRELSPESDRRWASKDQVYDEAIGWFLQQHTQQSLGEYPARRTGDADLTFWVDSRIMERVRRQAQRDGVKVARLIEAALSAWARQFVPESLLSFRHRVQEEAAKLYGNLRADPPAAARARRTQP